jgi:hypothetical protein
MQPKKIFSRGEIYVPVPKETKMPNNERKEVDSLNLKTKEVETQTREIKIAETLHTGKKAHE